jgi:hypothetical protein
MSVTVLGGFVVAETLPQPEVRPIELGGVVTVRPLRGWEVVLRERVTVPAPTGGSLSGDFAQLTRGNGALDLLALSERVRGIVLPNGLRAVRFGYIGSEPRSGSSVEGSVTAVVSPVGNGVVFDGWAFRGQLELIVEELLAMIEGAEVA